MAQLAVTPPMPGNAGARRTRLSWTRRATDSPTEPGAAPTTVLADQRATLAHVRVLEAALEEQVRQVAQLTAELEAERARPREDIRRISATVEGLRVAFRKDPVAQRLLARIDAALDRLVEPGTFARVRLPDVQPSVATPPTLGPSTNATTVTAQPRQHADNGTVADTDAPTRIEPILADAEPTDAPRRRRGLRR